MSGFTARNSNLNTTQSNEKSTNLEEDREASGETLIIKKSIIFSHMNVHGDEHSHDGPKSFINRCKTCTSSHWELKSHLPHCQTPMSHIRLGKKDCLDTAIIPS